MPPLLDSTPALIKFIYQLLGVAQFTFTTSPTEFLKIRSRLWCFVSYAFFIYLCVSYNLSVHPSSEVFTYLDLLVNCGNITYMIVFTTIFYKRSNKLETLLNQIQRIELDVPLSIRTKQTWIRMILLTTVSAMLICFPFRELPFYSVIYFIYPCIVNCFDNLFINDVFSCICDKFKTINLQLERINSVDLLRIFPLTKIDKIHVLEKEETDYNIQVIEQLSHYHYNLVMLTSETLKEFEVTILVAMVQWFLNMIDGNYTLIYLIKDNKIGSVRFTSNVTYVAFLMSWLYAIIAKMNETREVAARGGSFIHDVWNRYSFKGIIDKRIRHLELFSIRMLCTRVDCNVKGFFSLDFTFFHLVMS